MKKIIITILGLFSFVLTNAQKVDYGVKAGVNLASLSGYNQEDSHLVGFSGGLFTRIKITDELSFQTDLLFSTQGNKIQIPVYDAYSVEIYSYERKQNISYLNLAITTKYYVVDKLSLQVGPQIGLLLSAKAKDHSDRVLPGLYRSSAEYDIKDYLKTVDAGINLGIGYDLSESLAINIRYNLGLININNEPISSLNIKNKVLSVAFEYTF